MKTLKNINEVKEGDIYKDFLGDWIFNLINGIMYLTPLHVFLGKSENNNGCSFNHPVSNFEFPNNQVWVYGNHFDDK